VSIRAAHYRRLIQANHLPSRQHHKACRKLRECGRRECILSPALSRADLIIETHDVVCPGVTETSVRRFLPSYRIEMTYDGAKYADDFPVSETIPVKQRASLLDEGRKPGQAWMQLPAIRPEAIHPGAGRFGLYGGAKDIDLPYQALLGDLSTGSRRYGLHIERASISRGSQDEFGPGSNGEGRGLSLRNVRSRLEHSTAAESLESFPLSQVIRLDVRSAIEHCQFRSKLPRRKEIGKA
jgi:hypothetical protein